MADFTYEPEKYFLVGGVQRVQLWMHRGDSKVVHVTINDPRLRLPNSDKAPGGFLTFNDNPASANFNPEFLARCLEALRVEGVPVADHEEIFMRPRHLGRNMQQRQRYIEEYDRFNEPDVSMDMTFDVPESQVGAFREAIDRVASEFDVSYWGDK